MRQVAGVVSRARRLYFEIALLREHAPIDSNRLKDQYVSKYTPVSARLSTGLEHAKRWF
jgi:hypothetical protein